MRITRRALIFGGGFSAAALAQKQPANEYPDAAPFVATPPEVGQAMLRLANVRPDDVVYDLGSGDGRIIVAAAKDFGARAVGVEIDSDLNRDARDRAKRAGVAGKVRIIEGDLFQTPIGEATVVTMYLLPKTVDRLKPKLLSELKPGTRIVSFAFPISDWPPTKVEDISSRKIYLWVIPERAK